MIRTESIKEMTIKMLGNRDLHGYEIHRELEARDMKIGIGRLYDILNQMHQDGYLNDSWKESESGPKKRIYTLSEKGHDARDSILMEAIHTVHEFYGEYIRNLPHEKSPFTIVSMKLVKNLVPDSVIGFVVNKLTKSINQLLKNVKGTLPLSTIYLIGPGDVLAQNEMDGIPVVEGNCHDIPMKDEFFDLLVLVSYSGGESIEACVKEWKRVLRLNGRVSVVSPTALITKHDDPLDIGQYLELREHPPSYEGSTPLIEEITNLFNQHFGNLENDSIVHLTLLSSKK